MAQYVNFSSRSQPVPEAKQRSPFKRGLAIFFILLILLSSSFAAYALLVKDVPQASAAIPALALAPPAQPTLTWPTSGQAAIGSLSDGMLANSAPTENQKPIASMAKVVTALAVMEKQPFKKGETGETYTLTAKDVTYYSDYLAQQGSVIIVRDGEVLTQYQALQAILIGSSNNIAASLTDRVFGSSQAYVEYANAMVKEYGLTRTYVADPSGFSDKSVSVPSEMIALGQKALQNEVIAEIVAQSEATLPVVGLVQNTNKLMIDPNVVGIKTGTTDEAGACLLFAAKHKIDDSHEVTIIGVVMGQTDHAAVFAASKRLLESATKGFGESTVLPAEATVGTYTTPWGDSSSVKTKEALVTYGWKGTSVQPTYDLSDISTPQLAGAKVGTATLSTGETAPVSLILGEDLRGADIFWRFKYAATDW